MTPHQIIGEVVSDVAQGVAQEVGESVHRRFGWKGCTLMFLAVGALIAGTIYFIR